MEVFCSSFYWKQARIRVFEPLIDFLDVPRSKVQKQKPLYNYLISGLIIYFIDFRL